MYKFLLHLLILLSINYASAAEPLTNQLANNPSPYLALHGSDPVAWQAWDESVLERAKAENKLIYLSIGYFSCHWCHVMQRESYKDPEVAKWLNEHFIPVKIDRELEEALDARMIDFVEKTRGRAGWPLNVFVTPEGYPLYAVLYMPRNEFLKLITELQDLWQKDSSGMAALAREDIAEEVPLSSHQWSQQGAEQLVESLTYDALERADPIQGGFGDQAKFPSTPQLDVLLDSYDSKPTTELKAFLITTLDQMATQGLRDHIGGGFFRYTTDPDWQTPHFEKMLYDNAQLVRVYLRAAELLSRPDYTEIASDTLKFMQRELMSKEGAMAASLSAIDSNNVEGGYYLWTKDELKSLLSKEEMAIVEKIWLGKVAAHFDGGYLPMWQEGYPTQQGLSASDRKLLSSARLKMLKKRQQDRHLPVDNKLLAGWNGLALSAFSIAAKQFDEPDLRKTADSIAQYITRSLWQADHLVRARKAGKAMGQASLADYAFVAEGLWDYYQLTGNKQDFALLQAVSNAAWKRFYTKAGWSLGSMTTIESAGRQAIIPDGPQASPSSTLLNISYKLAKETDNKKLVEKVKTALGYDAISLSGNVFWYASQVRAILNSVERF
ncbi:MAG: hypothetical protein IEMM0001_2134 [bacterium]|nr:MAG: hypothetical protein IEMM0001_2134 [bacterium]